MKFQTTFKYMTRAEINGAITHAVTQKLKVKIQNDDTPEDQYELFQPYLLTEDLISGISITGLIEEQNGEPINTLGRTKLSGFKTVEVTDEKFEIPLRGDYIKYHDPQRENIILEVNPPME